MTRLYIEPEAMDDDLVLCNIFQKFIKLLLDGFTRYACGLFAGTWEHICIDIGVTG